MQQNETNNVNHCGKTMKNVQMQQNETNASICFIMKENSTSRGNLETFKFSPQGCPAHTKLFSGRLPVPPMLL